MRRLLFTFVAAVSIAAFVPTSAPALPAASIRCLQISPSTTPGSCTYKSTIVERETLSAATLQSWTLDWVDQGVHRSVTCTQGACRETPAFNFHADAGTTIHVTVTKGFVVVRQVGS